jgi:hypothetical protein
MHEMGHFLTCIFFYIVSTVVTIDFTHMTISVFHFTHCFLLVT